MEIFSVEARKLCIQLFGAIMESLNLDETHLNRDFERGTQIVGINCYHPCSESTKIGISPHTDHSIITLLLQSAPGLDFIDRVEGQRSWKRVPELKGSLIVLVGDHLEVMSNGLYKSVLHRAISSCDSTRFSIANWQSLAMDEVVEPATKLERENGRRYRGSSLRDFFNHIASGDARVFIETLRIGS